MYITVHERCREIAITPYTHKKRYGRVKTKGSNFTVNSHCSIYNSRVTIGDKMWRRNRRNFEMELIHAIDSCSMLAFSKNLAIFRITDEGIFHFPLQQCIERV
jgi:hypothetical protein